MSTEGDSADLQLLRALLACGDSDDREAFVRRCAGSTSVDDVARAGSLLRWLIETLRTGEAARWSRLDAAIEALGGAVDLDPESASVDVTLPAATEPQGVPVSLMDGDGTTTAELEAAASDLDDDPTESARHAPGGTLRTGKAPADAMDLDRYAILCAWTEVHPQRRKSLHEQYGLPDESARRALDAAFETRFKSDPSLRVAFAQRLRLHLRWLRSAGS